MARSKSMGSTQSKQSDLAAANTTKRQSLDSTSEDSESSSTSSDETASEESDSEITSNTSHLLAAESSRGGLSAIKQNSRGMRSHSIGIAKKKRSESIRSRAEEKGGFYKSDSMSLSGTRTHSLKSGELEGSPDSQATSQENIDLEKTLCERMGTKNNPAKSRAIRLYPHPYSDPRDLQPSINSNQT